MQFNNPRGQDISQFDKDHSKQTESDFRKENDYLRDHVEGGEWNY